jgi:hypothetical protein
MPRLHHLALAAALTLGASAQAADLTGLSKDVAPCDDFYAFVNGNWEAATEMPASRGRIGSFEQLRQANDELLDKALKELADKPELQTTPGLKLIAAYFASGMDEAAIEARGLSSVTPLLNRIDALQRREDLPALLALLNRSGIAAPLATGVRPDPKDTRRHVLAFYQSGLGLPDRDDYFRTDARTASVTAAYRTFAKALLGAANRPASDADVDALLTFETRLADASRARAQLRDPNASYNPMSLEELTKAAPGLDWTAYLGVLTAGAKLPQRVIVGQPEFATRLAQLAAETPLPVWRQYLALRVLDAAAPRLPKAFAMAAFDYRGKTLTGLQEPAPRSEDVIFQIGGRTGGEPMGLALGELFVARAFSPEAQKRAVQLLDDVRASMKERIEKLSWMTPATKTKALAKLANMAPKIGAPDKWPQYEGLQLSATDYAGNWLKVALWNSAQQMKDLDAPVDRGRWRMAHGAPYRQRVRRWPQRDHLSGRHPAAALLRRQGRRRLQLWRHRHGHRPRDHAPLRRQRPQLRRHRHVDRLVDARRRRRLPGPCRQGGRALRRHLAAARLQHQRPADSGRKHLRHVGPADRLRGPATCPQAHGRGRQEDRRLHARPALLHQQRPGLAQQGAHRVPHQPAAHRPALAGQVPRADTDEQLGLLRTGLQLQGRQRDGGHGPDHGLVRPVRR